jgi:hypothetical protein
MQYENGSIPLYGYMAAPAGAATNSSKTGPLPPKVTISYEFEPSGSSTSGSVKRKPKRTAAEAAAVQALLDKAVQDQGANAISVPHKAKAEPSKVIMAKTQTEYEKMIYPRPPPPEAHAIENARKAKKEGARLWKIRNGNPTEEKTKRKERIEKRRQRRLRREKQRREAQQDQKDKAKGDRVQITF